MFHQITIVGNLGKDPEIRYLTSGAGQQVATMNVATSRQYPNSQGQIIKETVWFRVSVWGKQAKACVDYLKKGSKVLIVGRMIPDPTTGGPRIWKRTNGESGASFEVSATTVRFLSSRSESGGGGGAVPHGGEMDTDVDMGGEMGDSSVPDNVSSGGMEDEVPF